MNVFRMFWIIRIITGVKVQKPIRRIKRTRSIKYHFLAKGLAKKSNPYKRKTRLFKKKRTSKKAFRLFKKKRRTSKKAFRLF